MRSTIDDILGRRSVRQYESRQISDEALELILQAGMSAPSGRNLQSAIIVALRNSEDIKTLSKLNARVLGADTDPFFGAPTVLVVLADAASKFAVQDGSLVMGNMMNAAYALGLGSCWVNRAKEVFELDEGKALLKKWGIDGEYVGIGNCVIGYPAQAPVMKPRKANYVYRVD